jgi:ABC-type glutathione transport system ATPase component
MRSQRSRRPGRELLDPVRQHPGLVGESASGKSIVGLVLLNSVRRGLTIATGTVPVGGTALPGHEAAVVAGQEECRAGDLLRWARRPTGYSVSACARRAVGSSAAAK